MMLQEGSHRRNHWKSAHSDYTGTELVPGTDTDDKSYRNRHRICGHCAELTRRSPASLLASSSSWLSLLLPLRGRWFGFRVMGAVFIFLAIVLSRWGRPSDFEAVGDIESDVPLDPTLLQLNVPFYMYDNELEWTDLLMSPPTFMKRYRLSKHGDDYWFLINALRHPLRTTDPDEAKLFFVPTLLNLGSRQGGFGKIFPKLCTNKKISPCIHNRTEVYHYVDQRLAASPFFQRSNGRDHVIVASHWTFRPDRWCNIEGPRNYTHSNILKCNLINFEGYIKGRSMSSPSMYMGKPCELSPTKSFDFAMTASLHPEKAVFQSRRDICQWLKEGNYSVSNCGEGMQCPALSQAKYGFHARGDTWGSNRVMDTVRSRTIPLFTDEEQYRILPSFVPWREMSYLVNVTTSESFHRSMGYVLSRPPSEYLKMQRLIGQYIHIFTHELPYQFDAYMADFAVRLGMQDPIGALPEIQDDYYVNLKTMTQ